jgi:hypothetical protein
VTLEEKQAIARRLTELTTAGGGVLTPEAVVRDARNRRSPLHRHIFRENDRQAAHQRRLDLARQLIRSVKINMTVDHRQIRVVAYVHDPGSQEEAGYVPTVTLVNQHVRAREAILREFTRAEGILRRGREIALVLGLEDDFEEMLTSIVDSIRRFESAVRSAA